MNFGVSLLKDKRQLVSDCTCKAEICVQQIKSVFTIDKLTWRQCHKLQNTIGSHTTDYKNLRKRCLSLKTTDRCKSTKKLPSGPYGFPNRKPKECTSQITPGTTYISF